MGLSASYFLMPRHKTQPSDNAERAGVSVKPETDGIELRPKLLKQMEQAAFAKQAPALSPCKVQS